MDGGFGYGDIIVIGAIAAFILLRYRAMLGENSGRDAAPRTPLSEYERIIQLPTAKPIDVTPKKEISDAQYGALAETFVAMRAIDRDFAPDEFLTGARGAYEMVLEAFNKPDRETLKMLLSDTLYKEFDAHIADSRTNGKVPQTILVAIKKADITEAALKGNTAMLTVDIVSEQIHLVRDSSGAVVEGNPSAQEPVSDRWVFSRNLANTDPNWKIIET